MNIFTKSKIFSTLLVSFLLGVYLAPYIKLNFIFLIVLILILVVLSIIFSKNKTILLIYLAGIFVYLGIGYFHWYVVKALPQKLPYNNNVEIDGAVSEEPEISGEKINIIIDVKKVISSENDSNLLGQKVLVRVNKYPEYKYGDLLKVFGKLEKPENFNGFDYQDYLMRFGIFSIINTTNVECIEPDYNKSIKSYLLNIKKKFKYSLEQSVSEPELSLAEGLILGVKGGFSKDLKEKMNQTGTTHIVVVSGQNMEIVAKVFADLTKYWSNLLSTSVGIIGLSLFTILTGATPSVMRAAVLASLFLVAKLVGRRKNIFIPLVFVGFVMVILNPLILKFDVGFQLSFMAMLGLIFITPIFNRLFIKLPEIIREVVSSTMGAQLATLPIIMYNFGRLTLLAPVANALILLTVPSAMFFSFFTGLFGLFSIPLAKISAIFSYPILKYIIFVIESFSKIPYNSVTINFASWIFVLIYYIILAMIIILANKHYDKK